MLVRTERVQRTAVMLAIHGFFLVYVRGSRFIRAHYATAQCPENARNEMVGKSNSD